MLITRFTVSLYTWTVVYSVNTLTLRRSLHRITLLAFDYLYFQLSLHDLTSVTKNFFFVPWSWKLLRRTWQMLLSLFQCFLCQLSLQRKRKFPVILWWFPKGHGQSSWKTLNVKRSFKDTKSLLKTLGEADRKIHGLIFWMQLFIAFAKQLFGQTLATSSDTVL